MLPWRVSMGEAGLQSYLEPSMKSRGQHYLCPLSLALWLLLKLPLGLPQANYFLLVNEMFPNICFSWPGRRRMQFSEALMLS